MNNCAQGYGCPNPSMSVDPFVPAGNRFVDVSAGGPTPFTFTATSNASWLGISPSKGSISANSPEQRVFLDVDWSKVSGAENALITFAANVQNQPPMSVTVTFTANKTEVPSGFSGTPSHTRLMNVSKTAWQVSWKATALYPLKRHMHPGTQVSPVSHGPSYLVLGRRCLA